MAATRIADAAAAAGYEARRIDEPGRLPPSAQVAMAFVDWDDRGPAWAAALRGWQAAAGASGPRLLLFGSHRDLAAHREARANGLGPMIARSKLFASLQSLLSE